MDGLVDKYADADVIAAGQPDAPVRHIAGAAEDAMATVNTELRVLYWGGTIEVMSRNAAVQEYIAELEGRLFAAKAFVKAADGVAFQLERLTAIVAGESPSLLREDDAGTPPGGDIEESMATFKAARELVGALI